MATIAIIGGGFSGVMTALNILRFEHASRPRVVLYERSGAPGPGVAYTTRSAVHFLNVPAGNMSAWEQDPSHFLAWVQLRHPTVTGGSFVPRAWYGDYLRDQLEYARTRAGGQLEVRRASVTAVRKVHEGRLTIEDDAGTSLGADRAVLAIGNFAPPPPPGLHPALAGHPGYIADPWKNDPLADVLPDEPVLMVGTGLTMVDVVMGLHAREHAGHLYAVSRHGLLPRPHRSPARPPVARPALPGLAAWDGRVKSLLRIVRESVREHAARGADWREVIASLRPVTGELWKRLDARERDRFLSRLRSYWEIVRHRAAPEAAAEVADLIAARQLTVRAGWIESIAPASGGPGAGRLIDVRFRPRRSGNPQTLRVSRVVNCLGPQTDPRRLDDPLVRQLLADGLATPDPHGLGFAVDAAGSPIGADGLSVSALTLIGPMRKGHTWENTAVPELRKQAAEAARHSLRSLCEVTVAAWPALRAGEAV